MLIDPFNFFVIPLALTLIFLFVAALIYDVIIFRRRRRRGNPVVYRCDSCRHIYSVPHRTPLARCPKCGNQNEPVRE